MRDGYRQGGYPSDYRRPAPSPLVSSGRVRISTTMLLAPTSHPIRVCSLALPPPPPRKLKRTYDAAQILSGVAQLEALLPGPPPFAPNMEAMKSSDWVGAWVMRARWSMRGRRGRCVPPPSLASSRALVLLITHPPWFLPTLSGACAAGHAVRRQPPRTAQDPLSRCGYALCEHPIG